MVKYKYRGSLFWRNLLTRILLVIIVAGIIISVLPKTESAQIHYDIGKPWMQGTVIAKFQFPIYKSDEVIQAERDSIVKHFPPYYKLDADIEKQCLDEFAKAVYTIDLEGLGETFKYVIIQELHKIYGVGVMGQAEYSNLAADTTNSIRLIDGKDVRGVSITDIYSTKAAYEKLFANKVLTDQRQTIQKYNLNNFIKPNLIYDKERSEAEREELLNGIIETDDMVMVGQKIIDKGEIVTPEIARVLTSLEREMMKRKTDEGGSNHRLLGQALLVIILLALFTTYLALFRRDYFENTGSLLMVYTLITLFPVMVSLMMRYIFFSVYILPFALLPIFVRIFLERRLWHIQR